jgi:hypothetical protein
VMSRISRGRRALYERLHGRSDDANRGEQVAPGERKQKADVV